MLTGEMVPALMSSGAAVPSPMAGTRAGSVRVRPADCKVASMTVVRASNRSSRFGVRGVAIRCATSTSPVSFTIAAANLVPPMSTARASRSRAVVMIGLWATAPDDVDVNEAQATRTTLVSPGSVQRVPQIDQQVVDVLDADGQPDQVV